MSKRKRDKDKKQRDAEADHEQFYSCQVSLSELHGKWARSGYEPGMVLSACSGTTARMCVCLGMTKKAYMEAMEIMFDEAKEYLEKSKEGN